MSYFEDNRRYKELRIQLWRVNQRATEAEEWSTAKIRYQETSSEDTAEE
jgi:hypothetical protein